MDKITLNVSIRHERLLLLCLKQYEELKPEFIGKDIQSFLLFEAFYAVRKKRAKSKLNLTVSQGLALYIYLQTYDITELEDSDGLNFIRYIIEELEKQLMKFKQLLYSKLTT